jgi:flagellar L-ring protein precursor FlgH
MRLAKRHHATAHRRLQAIVLLSACLIASNPRAESLYQEHSFRPLIGDVKAYRVGDLLTVQVFENSSATTSAETGTRRGNSLSAGVSNRNGVLGKTDVGISGEFDGGGRTQRANRLLATLTVSVREVLPNGDLRIGGEQVLTVNAEPQKVNLEGRVRPSDVSDGNVVLSTRLADAKISYVGEGDLAERNKRPWWRQFLDAAGL